MKIEDKEFVFVCGILETKINFFPLNK